MNRYIDISISAQLLQVPDAFSAHTALSPAHLSAPASTPIRSFHAAFPFPVATFLASPNGQQPSSVDDLKSEGGFLASRVHAFLINEAFRCRAISPRASLVDSSFYVSSLGCEPPVFEQAFCISEPA